MILILPKSNQICSNLITFAQILPQIFPTKQFGGGENLPECSNVFSKKVFTKIFSLKPSIKRATNLKRFLAVK